MNAYPHRVEAIDARPRSAVTALISVVLVWSVVSLTLAATDVGSLVRGPAGARVGPMTSLVAIASDRPTTTFDAGYNGHPDAIPAVVSAEAVTRSALHPLIGDVRFPASSIATSRIATAVARRGPPPSITA